MSFAHRSDDSLRRLEPSTEELAEARERIDNGLRLAWPQFVDAALARNFWAGVEWDQDGTNNILAEDAWQETSGRESNGTAGGCWGEH